MQAASRRGLSSILNLSAISRSSLQSTRQCISRRTPNGSATTKFIHAASIHCSPVHRVAATALAEKMTQHVEEQGGFITRFEDLATTGLVSKNVIDTMVEKMNLETMTSVQSQTINEALQGLDILGIARTGTGKTVAFLLPVIQKILQNNPELDRPSRKGSIDIQSIIISPTRELAEQIAKEAKRLVGRTGIQIGLAVGGTGRSQAIRQIQDFGCHILIGTPGRLKDVLSDRHTVVKAPRLSSFVLDEADRLLDDGFGPAIREIFTYLPSKLEVDRQTMMFSATMEQEVMGMVRQFMKKDFFTVRTIAEGEIQTHENVPQYAVVARGLENQMPALLELAKREVAANGDFKAIVFHSTAAQASLSHGIWQKSTLANTTGISGSVMHARLTQSMRTRTSNSFRTAAKAIMFASDVAARGMDFPNVTHVIQMGMPKDRDTYIHRIGRTGRAGREGQGWLFLTPWETGEYRRKLRDLPIRVDDTLTTATIDMSQASSIPQAVATILTDAISAAKSISFDIKSAAYRSALSIGSSMDKTSLIRSLNRWSRYGWGIDPPPAIESSLVRRLGFSAVKDLNVGPETRATRKDSRTLADKPGSSRGPPRNLSRGPPRGLSSRARDSSRQPISDRRY